MDGSSFNQFTSPAANNNNVELNTLSEWINSLDTNPMDLDFDMTQPMLPGTVPTIPSPPPGFSSPLSSPPGVINPNNDSAPKRQKLEVQPDVGIHTTHVPENPFSYTKEQLLKMTTTDLDQAITNVRRVRPLTLQEENETKRVRRLIRNRESAQASRTRKREKIEELQEQVRLIQEQKLSVEKELKELKGENNSLREGMKYLQGLVREGPIFSSATATESETSTSTSKGTKELSDSQLSSGGRSLAMLLVVFMVACSMFMNAQYGASGNRVRLLGSNMSFMDAANRQPQAFLTHREDMDDMPTDMAVDAKATILGKKRGRELISDISTELQSNRAAATASSSQFALLIPPSMLDAVLRNVTRSGYRVVVPEDVAETTDDVHTYDDVPYGCRDGHRSGMPITATNPC